MLKRVMGIMALLSLAACADNGQPQRVHVSAGTSWDQLAYVNPMSKRQWGAMKSLEQPGLY